MTFVGSLLVWVYVFQIIHCRQCLTSIFIRLGDNEVKAPLIARHLAFLLTFEICP
jgi:hypothetical protein